MLPYNTLDNLNVDGKTVLVRVDFNVPLDLDGGIASDIRIQAHIATIQELLANNAKVILMSHLGAQRQSLRITADRLASYIKKPVSFSEDCIGPKAKGMIEKLNFGEVGLLENTRAHLGEERNDEKFAEELASLADIYINDAFATAHRKHASVAAVAHLFTEKGIGRLMERELTSLHKTLENPKKPVLYIIGGAKISSKLNILKELIGKADQMIVGGAMAHTFLEAKGLDVGRSLYEPDMISDAMRILQDAGMCGCRILLPNDVVVADKFLEGQKTKTVNVKDIPHSKIALDTGAQSLKNWKKAIDEAGTIFWNGPIGAFEAKPFDVGTKKLAEMIGSSKAYKVAGGGDTLSALTHTGTYNLMDYVSTAGGALLAYLEGAELPALTPLKKSKATKKAS